jgi:hypothetical protein
MDSSVAAGIGQVGGAWTDPYLWAALAALFVGLAAGQVLRAFLRSRRRGDVDRRRRAARFARAIAYLSLGILALAALFVLADKSGLSEALIAGRSVLIASCAMFFVLGLCAGLAPLLLGLPIACLAFAALGFLRFALAGWLPIRSDSGSSLLIARLLPYEVGPSSFKGQLELLERDSLPVVQDLGFASSSVGIRVECIELKEPLRIAACIASPKVRAASKAYAGTLRLYRIDGLVAQGDASPGLDFKRPLHFRLLDAVLPLPSGEGLAPAFSPARAQALFGLAERTRRTSLFGSLALLQPLSFELALPDLSIALRP